MWVFPTFEIPDFGIPTVGIPAFGIPIFGILVEFRHPLVRHPLDCPQAKDTSRTLLGLYQDVVRTLLVGVVMTFNLRMLTFDLRGGDL